MPRYDSYRRRRLGGGSGSYASIVGANPLPVTITRKRKWFPSITKDQVPLRLGRRVRPRMARSFTVTKTKQKRRFGTAHKTGDNSSISSTRYGFAMSHSNKMLFRKLVGRQTYSGNTSTNFTSGQGEQGVFQYGVLSRDQMVAIKAQALGGTTNANNAKIFVGYVKHRVVFRNQSNSSGRVTLYDLVWKKNPVASSLDTPIEAWQKGYTDFGVTGNEEIIGNTPFQSPEFRNHVTVKKVTTLHLEPGQQHEHTVYYRVNRIINTTLFDNSGFAPVPFLTSYVMGVWHGSLGHELDNSKVTYMPMKLDIAQHFEYNYGWLPPIQSSFTQVNNMSKTVVDFDFMGENQDEDTNIEQA